VTDSTEATTVLLIQQDDARGLRTIEAAWRDGGIDIQGQDLGRGEYEWAWSVQRVDVPAIAAALGGREGDDPMRLLKAWCRANRGADPGVRLREAGVPIAFWSRFGD
jgi:hypothetical protein